MAKPVISIEVAYGTVEKQLIVAVDVPVGTTARQAAALSNIENEFDGLDVSTATLGLFGIRFGTRGYKEAQSYEVKQGDRIEIYRQLTIDPKEMRKRRSEKAKKRLQSS